LDHDDEPGGLNATSAILFAALAFDEVTVLETRKIGNKSRRTVGRPLHGQLRRLDPFWPMNMDNDNDIRFKGHPFIFLFNTYRLAPKDTAAR
jgi:hypothetical protein